MSEVAGQCGECEQRVRWNATQERPFRYASTTCDSCFRKHHKEHTDAVVNVARMLDNWWLACGVHQDPEDIGPELAAHADAISAAVQRLDQ